ncbi:MAG: carotenoid 1,2-hydratase [Pseudomonadota bacterium]|nr:carotenoid 1,2-hydratase [Pseudomonadota bacterium]
MPAEIRRESILPPVTKTRFALAVLALTLGLAAIFPALDHDAPGVSDESGMIAALIATQQGRLQDRPHDGRFKFPQDHGNHAEYPGESWRITGNLRDQTGRRFGLEFGIMRLAFGGKGTTKRASAWATREVFAGRLALSDPARARFYSDERMSRAALGLAGYQASPPSLWLEDWRLSFARSAPLAMNLVAAAQELRVRLTLRSTQDPLAAAVGLVPRDLVSYLARRLEVRGQVTIENKAHTVFGTAMLEHAWGRLPPLGGQLRWERLYLNLDDGRDLLLVRLQRRDGSGVPVSRGVIIMPDGEQRALAREHLEMETLEEWESPADGRRYPSRWRISLPSEGTVLSVEPTMADQEARGLLRRWAGAVRIEGHAHQQPIAGEGYVELMGW